MQAVETICRGEMRRTLALVLAGGNGTRLQGLTRHRAKPAVPFGGHHRIVDYALSNCVNSGISDIAVLTQYKAQSLTRHLQRHWLPALDASDGWLKIWPARQNRGCGWYAGTADAVHQNRDLIEAVDPDEVLILAGDHVYEMDYAALTASHARSGADVTLSCVEVPVRESREFGIVEIDECNSLKAFIEKPDWMAGGEDDDITVLASMGIYVFSTDYLINCLEADARDRASRHDFGYSILPRLVGDASIHVSIFRTPDGKPGYWRDVGTIDSYWLAHRELLHSKGRMVDERRLLGGGPRVCVPARIMDTATISESLLGADSVIFGTVNGSVVSTGCRTDKESIVTESVLLPGVTIGRNCVVNRAIIDSHCHIPDGTVIDARRNDPANGIHVSPRGITLVTAEAMLANRVTENRLRTA